MSEQHSLFPITLATKWQAPEVYELDAGIIDWLLDPNSLTARLKQHCQRFEVKVLGQCIQACPAIEANEDIQAGEQVLVREVLLLCNNKPQVFARSLLPLSSLTGDEQQLAHLGNQSLGQVLFNQAGLQRKSIQVSCFDQDSGVANLVKHLEIKQETAMWGRRSTFVLKGKPLMVAEVFLPGAFAYDMETSVK